MIEVSPAPGMKLNSSIRGSMLTVIVPSGGDLKSDEGARELNKDTVGRDKGVVIDGDHDDDYVEDICMHQCQNAPLPPTTAPRPGKDLPGHGRIQTTHSSHHRHARGTLTQKSVVRGQCGTPDFGCSSVSGDNESTNSTWKWLFFCFLLIV